MHRFCSLCGLVAVDFLNLHLLGSALTHVLSPSLLLFWLMGLERLVVLTLAARVLESKLPLWFQGKPLVVSCEVLSLLVPSCATITAFLLPQTSAELLQSWMNRELFFYCYPLTLTSAVICHQLILSSDDEEDEESSASVGRLIVLLRPYMRRFLIVAVFLVLSSWGEMAIPAYTGQMTDWIQSKEDPSIFWNTIIIMSLITLSSAVTEFLCDCIFNVTMSLVHTQTQGKLLHNILRQDITFFDTVSTGDITSRVTADTTQMSENLSENLSLLMWYLMRLIFLVVYMISLSPKLTLFTMLCLCIVTIVPQVSGTFYQDLAVKIQESIAKANQVSLETFSNMKTVRSFANEEGEYRRYEDKLKVTYKLNKMEALAYCSTAMANSFSSLALKVAILYFGGRLVTRGEVSGGALVSFVMYELQFAVAVEVLFRHYPDVRKAVGSSQKVFELMDRNPQKPPTGTQTPHNLQGLIEFRDVTFSYPKRPDAPVLQDISFKLQPGQVTALVGSCDSGKSTVVNLILKFYEPKSGEILLDGRPLSEYENKYYRQKVSVVSQESVLSARSLQDNIAYGMGPVSLSSVQAAAIVANADDFISEKPSGYQTGAGQKGELLSGGQRQRVALARALLRDPKILILDDATNSLDTDTELKIQRTVYENAENRTVLLISHRMYMVEKADHIMVLEGGRIVESGKHEDLLAREGSYWRMWNKQHGKTQNGNGEQQAPA